jgi:hypothetical protein
MADRPHPATRRFPDSRVPDDSLKSTREPRLPRLESDHGEQDDRNL